MIVFTFAALICSVIIIHCIQTKVVFRKLINKFLTNNNLKIIMSMSLKIFKDKYKGKICLEYN